MRLSCRNESGERPMLPVLLSSFMPLRRRKLRATSSSGLGVNSFTMVFITGFAAVALSAAQASPQAKVLAKPVHLRDLVGEVERMVAA